MNGHAPSWTRRVEAALFVAACALSLAFWVRLPAALPSDDDYRDAAAEVARGFAPGDAVVVAPAWAERWRVFLDVDPVLAVPSPEREDFSRTRRLWLVGLPDVPRSDFDDVARRLSQRFRTVQPPRRHGKCAVALYANPGYAEPTFDFRANVERASVAIGDSPCAWDGRAHRCRAASWLYVADELHEIEFLPRQCIWAHPAGSVPLSIRYSSVPVGRILRVRAGNASQVAWRKDPGWGPVVLTAAVGGRTVGALTVEVADGREQTAEWDTSAFLGSHQDVTFSVASDRPGNRHFCFDATAW